MAAYLGTEAQQIPASESTMNYGWPTPGSSDDELERVVLHSFGHAPGLIHEHQNPNTPISWNKAAVIADLSKPPKSWTPDVEGVFVMADDAVVVSVAHYPELGAKRASLRSGRANNDAEAVHEWKAAIIADTVKDAGLLVQWGKTL
jgi:hypothetical protein